MDNDPLGLGNFNPQALHPDTDSMNSGNLPSRPAHAMNPAKGPSGIGGWLSRNAQNIGGAVGGVIGGAVGLPANLLDAVSGVGGTALDAGAAAGGASIGGGIGQWIKNKLDPSQATNPLKEGAIQGATELAGQGILGGGSKLLKSAGKGLDTLGQHYAASQASGLSDDLAGKSIDIFNTMKNYGVKNINNFKDFANKVTGEDGVLNTVKQNILGRAPSQVNVARGGTQFGSTINDIINGTSTTDAEKKTARSVLDTVDYNLGKAQGRGNLAEQNPADVFKHAQQALQKKAASVARGVNPSSEALAAKQMYNDMASEYEKQINKVVGDNAVTAEDKQALHEGLNKAGLTNKNLHADVENVKSYGDIRKIESTAVNAGKIADQTAKASTKGMLSKFQNPATMAEIPAVGAAALLHTPALAAAPLLMTKTAKAEGGPALEKLGDVSSAVAKGLKAAAGTMRNTTEKNALPALGLHGATQALKTQGQESFSPQSTKQGTGPVSSQISSMVNDSINSITKNTQQAPIPQLTDQQINSILQSSGTMGLRAIDEAIDTQLSVQKQEEPELTSTQQDQIADITKALQGISDASTLYDQAYALGAGTGELAKLGTMIPGIQNTKSESALKAYDDNRADLAAQIATILGSGRSSASMIKQIETELPSATDSPMAAQTKFSLLVTRLNASMQSTLAVPATNTPGQLANFAGQTVPGLNQAQPENLGLLNFIGAQ